MAGTYKTRYGADWPAEMPDAFIGMTVAKKWRWFRDEGDLPGVIDEIDEQLATLNGETA